MIDETRLIEARLVSRSRESESLRWFALFTNPRCERRVEQRALDDGLCVYLPEGCIWSKPRRAPEVVMRLRPAMSRYIFIAEPRRSEPDWFSIRRMDGVHSVVGVAGLPLSLHSTAIDTVRAAQDIGKFNFGKEPVKKAGRWTSGLYQRGDQIRINKGPFEGFNATAVRASDQMTVEIELMLFGRASVTRVPLDFVAEAA